MRLWEMLGVILMGQRGALMPWAPVMLSIGIGGYFTMRTEPAVWALAAVLVLAAAVGIAAWRIGPGYGPLLVALSLILAGWSLAGARAHWVGGPVLDFRYYGAIEGRVVGIDRSASGALRLTLDQVRLERVTPVPRRVRISLHGTGGETPVPGMRVMTTGHLSAPQGPVEPGGFDFRRHAWFLKLGAVGYTRVPLLAAAMPEGDTWLLALRMRLSHAVQAALPGEVGVVAAAITTGDRSGLEDTTQDALRATNLSHLLAISGLHMGLVAGFVFASVRIGIAAIPFIALRLPARKIAALAALLGAAAYLSLSGGNVATQRAFVMVAVALCAVLVDRRAISLRAVAVAAMIVLVLRPESLLGPGFQMSFAATTALVVVFTRLRDLPTQAVPRWAWPVLAVVISSAVAGFATAPVAAAHFNRIAQFGLIANLTTVPLMGAVVMPAAVLAACLAPLGLEGVALWVMGAGLSWVLTVAHEISGWEGAVRHIVAPGAKVLPLLAAGGLLVALWRSRAAAGIGIATIALAFLLWAGAERPLVLIAENGSLVSVDGQAGRALSRPVGAGFVARVWLENDGDGAEQAEAAERWPEKDGPVTKAALPGGGTLWHVRGKRGRQEFPGCGAADVAVFSTDGATWPGCQNYTPASLRQTGAIAFYVGADGLRTVTAKSRVGQRLWSPSAPEREEKPHQYVRINPTKRP